MSGEEKKLEPAEDNPWYKFLLETIELDNANGQEHGWHWFWGFYFINLDEETGDSKYNFTDIKSKVPPSHWLKEISDKYDPVPALQSSISQMDMMHGVRLAQRKSEPSSTFEKIRHDLLERDVFSALESCLNESEDSDKIDFSKLLFDKPVDFSNFIFLFPVSFLYSEFSYHVTFTKAFFYRSADFTITKFLNKANFDNARFLSTVTFSVATFSGIASFANVIFSDDAIFYKADFSDSVFFTDAKFSRIATFGKTKFGSLLFFSNATLSIGADFSNATFFHRALFDQVKITGYTTFRNAEFKEYPPSFHNVNMYSDIIWDEIRWPKLNKKLGISIVDQNKNAYENLASHMKKLDRYHDEHFFYRQEMRCRRRLTKNPFTRSAYWLYEIFADYGYGFERALFWWGLNIFLGIFFIGFTTQNVWCSFITSFANAHGFLPLHNRSLKSCYEPFMTNDFFNAIWTFQIIVGIPLLFLVLLTLRVRFRLK